MTHQPAFDPVDPVGPVGPVDPGDDADRAVALERLHGTTGYPPGFYGSLSQRLPVFAMVGALIILAGVIPFNHRHATELELAGALFVVTTTVALVVPWHRAPSWCWMLVPLGYLALIDVLRDAQGGYGSGLTVALLLPVVWITFYGRRIYLAIALGALAAALILPVVIVGPPAYSATQWRGLVVFMVVATLVSFTILTMGRRDRSYVADVAGQSALAHRNARVATEARAELASLLQAATGTAIIGANAKGLVTFFSAGAARILGYDPDEAVGSLTIYDLVPARDRQQRRHEISSLGSRRARAATVGTSGIEESVWTCVRRDGVARRMAVTVTPRPGVGRVQGFVVVATDVTEREQLTAERERLLAVQREVTQVLVEQNQRLRELTRMKDELVATVSHELGTPLTSIRGFVELLLMDPENQLDLEQVRMLRTIERNSLQLMRMAQDLISDPGGSGLRLDFTDTDLAEVASHAVEAMHAQAAERRVTISCEAPSPVVVRGDPSRLRQLLDNLLSNAVKFNGPGGAVLVRVSAADGSACLDVFDNGPGIPLKDRDQLFDRFYRLANATTQGIPGTGLGLAIAKSVVEAHGGTLSIVDAAGWSTAFRALLPLAEPEVHGPAGDDREARHHRHPMAPAATPFAPSPADPGRSPGAPSVPGAATRPGRAVRG